MSDLTLELNNAFLPAGLTFIDDEVEYPIPELMIITSVILWFDITGLNSAPTPLPVESITSRSGTEKYSPPPDWIVTSEIAPFLIIGVNDAFLPFFKVIIGLLWLLTVVEP